MCVYSLYNAILRAHIPDVLFFVSVAISVHFLIFCCYKSEAS